MRRWREEVEIVSLEGGAIFLIFALRDWWGWRMGELDCMMVSRFDVLVVFVVVVLWFWLMWNVMEELEGWFGER